MTWLKEHFEKLLFSLSPPLPFWRQNGESEGEEERTFSKGNYAVISLRHTQKGIRREWLPCHEKEKLLLACQEMWAKAFPGGLLGAHDVLLFLGIRGPISELAINAFAICSVIILFLRYHCCDSCPVCNWWLLQFYLYVLCTFVLGLHQAPQLVPSPSH